MEQNTMGNRKDLTMPLVKSCICRNFSNYLIHKVDLADRLIPMSLSTVTFSVHSITHIDLPWGIQWLSLERYLNELIYESTSETDLLPSQKERVNKTLHFFKKLVDADINEEIPRKINELGNKLSNEKPKLRSELFSKWLEYDAIVLDFSNKKDVVNKYLKRDSPTRGFIPYMKDMTVDEAESLFNELKITLKEIKDKLKDIFSVDEKDLLTEINNKVIIIKTGWTDSFLPGEINLSNPIFEGWHVYLTYPYLGLDAIEYLLGMSESNIVNYSVAGVCSDTICLESPVYYVDFRSNTFKEYMGKLLWNRLSVFPFHIGFLSQNKLVIENLMNTRTLENGLGKVYVFPIDLGANDAAIAKVFFEPLI